MTDEPQTCLESVILALSQRKKYLQSEMTSGSSAPEDGVISDDPPEACLRVFMTNVLPKLQRKECKASEFQLGYALLETILYRANHADLRFVDAWNCAYETIESWGWERAGLSHWRSRFLSQYIEILEHSIAEASVDGGTR